MEVAVAAGQVAEGAALPLATNQLVVIYPAGNPGEVNGLADLARPGLKLVLAAPEVPAGRYTLDFLDKAARDPALGAGYREAVLSNVVSYEQNVRSVLSKVALGEADGGVVYRSDAAGQSAEEIGRLEIPEALNVVATYLIAPVAGSAHPDLARRFVELALSGAGQAVLAEHGFTP
jgi:molybdate transport system substrate-binding protein